MFDIPPSTEQAAEPVRVSVEPLDIDTAREIRKILLRLASDQDRAAADEAAAVPYWKPCPDSVRGSRAAARALRAVAESIPIPLPPIGA